jgi:hypothetical protein
MKSEKAVNFTTSYEDGLTAAEEQSNAKMDSEYSGHQQALLSNISKLQASIKELEDHNINLTDLFSFFNFKKYVIIAAVVVGMLLSMFIFFYCCLYCGCFGSLCMTK